MRIPEHDKSGRSYSDQSISGKEGLGRKHDVKETLSGSNLEGTTSDVRKGLKTKLETRDSRSDGNVLDLDKQGALLATLKNRFGENMNRHRGLEWSKVQEKLEAQPEKIWSLNEMERTGGAPDVVGFDKKTGEYIFYDCSKESPNSRGMLVYDKDAEESLKKNYPDIKGIRGNAVDMAAAMGIEMLDPAQFEFVLQKLGDFNLNSLSWFKTPAEIRMTGRALRGRSKDKHGGGSYVSLSDADGHGPNFGFRGMLRV